MRTVTPIVCTPHRSDTRRQESPSTNVNFFQVIKHNDVACTQKCVIATFSTIACAWVVQETIVRDVATIACAWVVRETIVRDVATQAVA